MCVCAEDLRDNQRQQEKTLANLGQGQRARDRGQTSSMLGHAQMLQGLKIEEKGERKEREVGEGGVLV